MKTVGSKSLMSFLIESISYPALLFAGGISSFPVTPGRSKSWRLTPGFLLISPWVPLSCAVGLGTLLGWEKPQQWTQKAWLQGLGSLPTE